MANHPATLDDDDTRRTIFERVARRPISVGKLAEGLDVTRPAVSQHLKVLLRAGLVVQRREGRRCFYQVDPRDHARLPRPVLGSRARGVQARSRTGGHVISVKKQIVVETSQQRAFRTFTDGIDRWWPREHHIGTSPLDRMVIEPRAGGRWYSICRDGSEVDVGKAVA